MRFSRDKQRPTAEYRKIERLKRDGHLAQKGSSEAEWFCIYTLGYNKRYETKHILKSISNDDASTDSDGEVFYMYFC